MVKVMVISGSPRKRALTRGLAGAVEQALSEKDGVQVLSFDVGRDVLPLYTGEESDYADETVRRLVTAAEQADGFVITSPEYHNGMSGALKNALDFLSGTHFRGKPTLIMAVGGGGKGGINALNNMRTVLRGLYALVLPDQFVADPIHFDGSGRLASEEANRRVRDMVNELLRIAAAVRR